MGFDTADPADVHRLFSRVASVPMAVDKPELFRLDESRVSLP